MNYGPIGYAAHLNDLSDNLTRLRQTKRDMEGRIKQRRGGVATPEQTVRLEEMAVEIEAARVAYDRAAAEA